MSEETIQADAIPYLPTSATILPAETSDNTSPIINKPPESITSQLSSSAVSTQQSPPIQAGIKNLTINSINGTANVASNFCVHITNSGKPSDGAAISLFKNKVIVSKNKGNVKKEILEADPDCKEIVKQEILDSELPLSMDNRYLIAENISNDYPMLARFLPGGRLTTSQIQNIQADNREFGQKEIVYKILDRWSEKAPEKATVGQLALALQKIGKVQLANRLSLEDVVEDDD